MTSNPDGIMLPGNSIRLVDVGASGGIDRRWTRVKYPCHAILFEPDPKAFRSLKALRNANTTVFDVGLSDRKQVLPFNLCRKGETSSVYKPNNGFLAKFPDPDRVRIEEIVELQVNTLDTVLADANIDDVDFIKCDAQGYDLSILKGSVASLGKCIGLEVEVCFAPLYLGQPYFADVDIFARQKGFELFDLKRYYWKRSHVRNAGRRKGQLVFGDALYLRTPEAVMEMYGHSPDKVFRAFQIYLIYAYGDLAETLLVLSKNAQVLSGESLSICEAQLRQFSDSNLLPNFPGKGRIQLAISRLADVFRPGLWCANDSSLGGDWL